MLSITHYQRNANQNHNEIYLCVGVIVASLSIFYTSKKKIFFSEEDPLYDANTFFLFF